MVGCAPVTRRFVAIALCLAATLGVLACGSDDGGDTQKVSDSQIPFTFELPKDFQKKGVQPGSSQGAPPIVAYGIDKLNLVDVRKSASRELPLDSVDKQVKASLGQLGFANEQSKREKHSDIDMVVFDIDNKVSGQQTNSKLYFFSGGGGTWELECQSSGDKADELNNACTKALDSVDFTKE
jgi:hypothetical protein